MATLELVPMGTSIVPASEVAEDHVERFRTAFGQVVGPTRCGPLAEIQLLGLVMRAVTASAIPTRAHHPPKHRGAVSFRDHDKLLKHGEERDRASDSGFSIRRGTAPDRASRRTAR
ncbi:hypothetical protein HDU96_000856 [Phlyctochytrium bullatum]|nr:hypothetical protein HDU96_000856 [Phlyctochytrium bullatum]